MTREVRENLTWQDICEIVEWAFGCLGKNVNDELMGQYKGPKDFYEILLKGICGRYYGD